MSETEIPKRSNKYMIIELLSMAVLFITITGLIWWNISPKKEEATTAQPAASQTALPTQQPATPTPTEPPEYMKNILAPVENPIYLTWAYRATKLEDNQGINVISPTWLYVTKGKDGKPQLKDINMLGKNVDYTAFIQEARNKGIKVWPAVVSFQHELSSQIVNDYDTRMEFLDTLQSYLIEWGADGINYDFEYMNPEHKFRFTSLMIETKNRMPHLKLSVDVTVKLANPDPSNWYQCYDHAALANIVDYIAIMSYKANSSYNKAGAVAPYDWVEEKIQLELLDVPSNKILLGIPFYGYDYIYQMVEGDPENLIIPEDKSSQKIRVIEYGQMLDVMENGSYNIGSNTKVIVEKWIDKYGWDSVTQTPYMKFVDNMGFVHLIYYDNPRSIALKTQLAKQYNLAGAAVWVRHFGHPDMWTSIDDNIYEVDTK